MNREQRIFGEINITHDCSMRLPVRPERRWENAECNIHINAVRDFRNTTDREAHI